MPPLVAKSSTTLITEAKEWTLENVLGSKSKDYSYTTAMKANVQRISLCK